MPKKKRRILNKIGEVRMALELVFPNLKYLPRFIKTNPSSLEDLPEPVRHLVEEYRRSLADTLGISPEQISEEFAIKWATKWLKRVLSPEAWNKLVEEYPELLEVAA